VWVCDFCLVGLESQNPTTSSPQLYTNTANSLSVWVFWRCCSVILVAEFLGGFVTALSAHLCCRGSRCRPSWVSDLPFVGLHRRGSSRDERVVEMRENTEMREEEAILAEAD
jgi:hypothetical protein